jgi:hypothetical protein
MEEGTHSIFQLLGLIEEKKMNMKLGMGKYSMLITCACPCIKVCCREGASP